MDRKPRGYWNKERCAEKAREYGTKTEFRKGSHSAYLVAHKRGWIDEICAHMTPRYKPSGYWNKERCAEVARKYKTRKDFLRECSAAHSAAYKNGWIDEICAHMTSSYKPRGHWNKERCAEVARKYKTRKDFSVESASAYMIAHKRGWLDEICAHMVRAKTESDSIYVWEVGEMPGVFKIGVATSSRGNERIKEVARSSGLTARVVTKKIVANPYEVERLLLSTFDNVADVGDIDGKTEFRHLNPRELMECVSLIESCAA